MAELQDISESLGIFFKSVCCYTGFRGSGPSVPRGFTCPAAAAAWESAAGRHREPCLPPLFSLTRGQHTLPHSPKLLGLTNPSRPPRPAPAVETYASGAPKQRKRKAPVEEVRGWAGREWFMGSIC